MHFYYLYVKLNIMIMDYDYGMNSKSSMEILQETGKIAIKDNISNNSHKLDFENRICCGYERT